VLSILIQYYPDFLKGLWTTLEASVLALIGSFAIGILIAVFRIVPFVPLNIFGRIYTEFLRNIPLLIVAFFFFHGMNAFGLNLSGFVAGTLGLTFYTSSFIAEAIRAGILSVPKGQMEAGRSTGLTYVQTMRYVILPQAIKIVIPPLGNQFLNLVKNSSILSLFAGLDLMYWGDHVASSTFKTLPVYTLIALFYLLITIPLSYFVRWLEIRLNRLPKEVAEVKTALMEG